MRMQVNSQEQSIVEKARQLEKLIAKHDKLKAETTTVEAEIQTALAEMQTLLPVKTATPPAARDDEQPGVTPIFAGAGSSAR